VNGYEVKAGMVLFAGKTVWSMPQCLRGFTTSSRRCVNPRYLYILPLLVLLPGESIYKLQVCQICWPCWSYNTVHVQ